MPSNEPESAARRRGLVAEVGAEMHGPAHLLLCQRPVVSAGFCCGLELLVPVVMCLPPWRRWRLRPIVLSFRQSQVNGGRSTCGERVHLVLDSWQICLLLSLPRFMVSHNPRRKQTRSVGPLPARDTSSWCPIASSRLSFVGASMWLRRRRHCFLPSLSTAPGPEKR